MITFTEEQLNFLKYMSIRFQNSIGMIEILETILTFTETTLEWAERVVNEFCSQSDKNALEAVKQLKWNANIGLIEAKFLIDYYYDKKFPRN